MLYSKCIYNAINGCVSVLWSMLVFKIAVISLSLFPKITIAHTTPFVLPGQRISCTETFLVLHKKVLTLMLGIISWVIQRTTHTHTALTWRESLDSTVQLCGWTLLDTRSWRGKFLHMVLYPCLLLNQCSLHLPSLKRPTALWPWRRRGMKGTGMQSVNGKEKRK